MTDINEILWYIFIDSNIGLAAIGIGILIVLCIGCYFAGDLLAKGYFKHVERRNKLEKKITALQSHIDSKQEVVS